MRIVLISGCSSGFGLELTLAFAHAGDTVIATMRDTALLLPKTSSVLVEPLYGWGRRCMR